MKVLVWGGRGVEFNTTGCGERVGVERVGGGGDVMRRGRRGDAYSSSRPRFATDRQAEVRKGRTASGTAPNGEAAGAAASNGLAAGAA